MKNGRFCGYGAMLRVCLSRGRGLAEKMRLVKKPVLPLDGLAKDD
jgi:hypothetical protein